MKRKQYSHIIDVLYREKEVRTYRVNRPNAPTHIRWEMIVLASNFGFLNIIEQTEVLYGELFHFLLCSGRKSIVCNPNGGGIRL